MIRLVVGLGNPGQQYKKNRHNAGFLLLDRLVDDLGASWANESKFHGHVAVHVFSQGKVLFLKPQTYMNKSGLSVAAIARFFKIEPEEILVVHDELDFDVGCVKLKKSGGHAGNNGLRDIIACLGVAGFYRVRVGIGRPRVGDVANYVLSDPSKQEMLDISLSFDTVLQKIEDILFGDMALSMNELNR
ncbi:MAG: aminoacyl-tRNA hydrolase [Methylococcales bacterium]|nr:aminoacyl-tRNA hydrolase [Methylococcales bacterium]